jgi:alpha-D-ribose 1-methylphosphonate 5-triphosphate synthase subunit PhnH
MTMIDHAAGATVTAPFDPGIGFVDPVFESQAAFRVILEAMAEPGTIGTFAPRHAVPAGLMPATATILLTVADYETPVFMPPAWQQGEAGQWLRFHAGAPAALPGEAAFAIMPAVDLTALPGPFRAGNEMFPDQSTTLILQLPALTGGAPLEIAGPGILGTRRIAPLGLTDNFPAIWAANHRLYPLGVDLILVTGHQIMGLPRSARLVRPDHNKSGHQS